MLVLHERPGLHMIKFINKKRLIVLTFGITAIFLTTILAYHEVDNSLTEEDKQYITKYLEETNILPLLKERTFKDELDFIVQSQNAVLKVAPANEGIPFNTKREPKELYLSKTGLCYDRSRVIEKILRYSGFRTRHISIYSIKQTHSSLKSLLTSRISSHAVTEVLTLRGWLVVDSNSHWVSINGQGNPVSIEQISSDGHTGIISWNMQPPSKIYEEPFVFVYGLYSRHGRFYPPYNFLPDVNYKELIQNVL